MDYSKLSSRDIEERATHGGSEEKRVKKAGFDQRMQRVEEAMGKAKTEKEYNHLKELRSQSLGYYNKYNNSNYKS